MSETPDPPTNPETPWEFLPDDEHRPESTVAAEEDAVHLEEATRTGSSPSDDPSIVVHYEPDEHPEAIDLSEPIDSDEVTPSVAKLLERQHYLATD